MVLFRQFFAQPHRRPGEAHFPVRFEGQGCWWNDPAAVPLAAGRGFNVHVVGESQFQGEIAAIVGGRCEEGHNCHVPAQLVLAGTAWDPDAVGVTINSRPVGWLPPELARALRPWIATVRLDGKALTCKAKIVGGWDRGRADRGFFGVKLSLSLPPKIHPEAAAPGGSRRPSRTG
jgi:hypothetical protein